MITLVLAFTMPLCCCIVNTATGATDACSSITGQEEQMASCCQKIEKSCCSQQDTEEEPDCCGCSCAIKGTIFVRDWTPPVDLIGKNTPAPFFVNHAILAAKQDAITFAHGPPKYNSHILGFSSAPPIRGTLILEV